VVIVIYNDSTDHYAEEFIQYYTAEYRVRKRVTVRRRRKKRAAERRTRASAEKATALALSLLFGSEGEAIKPSLAKLLPKATSSFSF